MHIDVLVGGLSQLRRTAGWEGVGVGVLEQLAQEGASHDFTNREIFVEYR